MAQVLPNGNVVPPLNITAPAPDIDLKGFFWDTVDAKIQGLPEEPEADSSQAPLAEFEAVTTSGIEVPDQLINQLDLQKPGAPRKTLPFPLTAFSGSYAGNGFNMIFRPRSDTDTTNFKKPPTGPADNILELNLTLEQLTFGNAIGDIPNRGLGPEPDITLGGIPYMQTIQDVTNPSTGKGDNLDKTGIHFEPGMWLFVPSAQFQNKVDSVCRMASIPHGTTIHAQGAIPKKSTSVFGGVPGGPKFGDAANIQNTTPFELANPSNLIPFPSMTDSNPATFRIPQDLTPFMSARPNPTINTAIIKNPNIVLQNAIQDMTILETITFDISTGPPTAALNGGGTANISFLAGQQPPTPSSIPINPNPNIPPGKPIAHADFMRTRYWIELVEYDLIVPKATKQTTFKDLKPKMPNSSAPTPLFTVTTPAAGLREDTPIKVQGVQIQSSQRVNLNFGPPRAPFILTWPHVSVSTLVPTEAQIVKMK